ncbi:DUF3016 domain-containing protein [Massilia sp. 9096]|uniref:DUF3016 domain-containing protein n=1 Tax=Massilia sp. 9096 TaxID=1500894 RepID=UPI0005638ABC|nr:DUF3016 domain-containing protein [Massilia sp. 9096]
MKTTLETLALAGLLALAAGGAAAATTVNYIQPDKFSDIPFTPWEREDALKHITDHFNKLGESLPPGQDLRIDVLDVDLAGREIPSARNGRDLRIMTGRADWPRMKLRYAVEQGGQVIKSGESQIQDMDYQNHLNQYFDSDPFRYEKQMMDDWFVKNIGPLKDTRRRR